MSEATKNFLRQANATVEQGDHAGFLEHCTEDTVWTFLGDRTLQGKAAVRQWMDESYKVAPTGPARAGAKGRPAHRAASSSCQACGAPSRQTKRIGLASWSPEELEQYLESTELVALTPATLTDRDRMRQAILATRQKGWAWVDGVLDESICGLAVPVRDRTGATIAAMNVSLSSEEFTQEQVVERFLGELRVAASRLRASDR